MAKLATIYGFKVAALFPTLWLFIFLTFVLRARISLGHFPYPYNPDPKDLGFDLHAWMIYLVFLGSMATVVIFPLALRYVKQFGIRVRRIYSLIFAASWTLIVVLCVFDPGQFLTWFLD